MIEDSTVDGVPQLDAALRRIISRADADTERDLTDYASDLVDRAQKQAARTDRLARMVAGGLSASRARGGGELAAGGGDRLPSGTGTYGQVFFGAEWGGGSRPETQQFRPWKPAGYWFYPAVREAAKDQLPDVERSLVEHTGKVWAG